MQILNNIIQIDMLKVPDLTMDYFQQEISNHLYLEFFLEDCRALITPDFDCIPTGPASEEELGEINNILLNHQETLEKVRKYLIYNLTLYSSLLETNSFYIELNNYVVISRFLSLPEELNGYEVKLYTMTKSELIKESYDDKIYLGRDILYLKSTKRDYFGLPYIRNSLKEQIEKVKKQVYSHVNEGAIFELESEYIKDIQAIVNDFLSASKSVIDALPADLGSKDVETKTLIEANKQFRDLKHILIELEQALTEIESYMFKKDMTKAVRYITKFKKDITNDINYIMIKVNGRISDYVNKIKI